MNDDSLTHQAFGGTKTMYKIAVIARVRVGSVRRDRFFKRTEDDIED